MCRVRTQVSCFFLRLSAAFRTRNYVEEYSSGVHVLLLEAFGVRGDAVLCCDAAWQQAPHESGGGMSAGCLKAAAYVHAEGVVHESVGLGAFMMSTVDDAQADRLFMKLDNFGVAKAYTGASGPDSALGEGIKRDQEALVITFCELIFGTRP